MKASAGAIFRFPFPGKSVSHPLIRPCLSWISEDMCFKITGARIPSKLLASTMPKTVRLIFQQSQFPRRFPLQCCFSYSRYTHDIYKITKLTMRNLSVKFNQYQIFSNQVCIFLSLPLLNTLVRHAHCLSTPRRCLTKTAKRLMVQGWPLDWAANWSFHLA